MGRNSDVPHWRIELALVLLARTLDSPMDVL